MQRLTRVRQQLRTLSQQEAKLVTQLQSAAGATGFRLVPTADSTGTRSSSRNGGVSPTPILCEEKRAGRACPHATGLFSNWAHWTRHMTASHPKIARQAIRAHQQQRQQQRQQQHQQSLKAARRAGRKARAA